MASGNRQHKARDSPSHKEWCDNDNGPCFPRRLCGPLRSTEIQPPGELPEPDL